MAMSLVNYFLLTACLFLLFYSALTLNKVIGILSPRNGSLKNLCTALVCMVAAGVGLGVYLLPGVSGDTFYRMLLFSFYLSVILTVCASVLHRCSRLIADLQSVKTRTFIDPLTGIYNQGYLSDRLESEMARSKRYSCPLGIVAVDVVNLHHHNMVYGFQSGDRLLKVVAAALIKSVRETDVVARYNGSAFVVVLTNTPEASVTTVVDRLQKCLLDNLESFNNVTTASGYNNVKFGKAWSALSTRSGTDLIGAALEQIQAEKVPLNKQDTSVELDELDTVKLLEKAA